VITCSCKSAATTHSVHKLGKFDGVEVLEFVPLEYFAQAPLDKVWLSCEARLVAQTKQHTPRVFLLVGWKDESIRSGEIAFGSATSASQFSTEWTTTPSNSPVKVRGLSRRRPIRGFDKE
jgi:hypothetical protein